MEEQEIKKLLIRYAEGKCTEEEKSLVESAYLFQEDHTPDGLTNESVSNDLSAIYDKLPKPRSASRIWYRVAAAACVFICLTVGLFKVYVQSPGKQNADKYVVNPILPGKNVASLTLSNGKVIPLQGAKQAVVINTKELSYQDGSPIANTADTGYQSVQTPKGGQYKVVLSDGTEIMLNADTYLKYPTNFQGLKNRKVELKGEAYFEVAKDKHHPFLVETGDQKIEVLGTHFNVSHYDNEPEIKTTLLEGAVKVTINKTALTKELRPGQQSTFAQNNLRVRDVETDDAVAWKNGYFMFNYERLDHVMLEISRWYNVDLTYDDPSLKNTIFFGTISKFNDISKVLNMLERTKKVKFEIEGRVVRVKNAHV